MKKYNKFTLFRLSMGSPYSQFSKYWENYTLQQRERRTRLLRWCKEPRRQVATNLPIRPGHEGAEDS